MKSLKYLWGVALIALIIAIGVGAYALSHSGNGLGASGDINTVAVRFIKGLSAGVSKQFNVDNTGMITNGGAIFSTTTAGTVTMLASDVVANGTFLVNPSIGTVTYTLPTKANIALLNPTFLPNQGDTVTKWLTNASTTPSGTTGIVRIVGSAGTIVRNVSTSTASDFLYGGNEAKLVFRRSATSTDIYVDITIFH